MYTSYHVLPFPTGDKMAAYMGQPATVIYNTVCVASTVYKSNFAGGMSSSPSPVTTKAACNWIRNLGRRGYRCLGPMIYKLTKETVTRGGFLRTLSATAPSGWC